MEELNLFIKSIFIDNMIFAYFLGMCSFLATSWACARSWRFPRM